MSSAKEESHNQDPLSENDMTYEEIIRSLPEDLRAYVGGNHELTESLWREGKFRLLSFNVGDRVRMKSTSTEYTVVFVAPESGRFQVDPESEWLYVPWADMWEKVG